MENTLEASGRIDTKLQPHPYPLIKSTHLDTLTQPNTVTTLIKHIVIVIFHWTLAFLLTLVALVFLVSHLFEEPARSLEFLRVTDSTPLYPKARSRRVR